MSKQPQQWFDVCPGLGFAKVYWTRGGSGRAADGKPYEVSDPPTSGWSTTYVLTAELEQGFVTLFNPYAFKTHRVSVGSVEFSTLTYVAHGTVKDADAVVDASRPDKPPMHATSIHWMRGMMRANWSSYQRPSDSEARDFETAGKVLEMIGGKRMKTPERAKAEKKVGGSQSLARLVKPVKRAGRKGQVLAFFTEKDLTGNVSELEKALGIDRKNILSQLYLLKKDHGIGYELNGESVTVTLPEGCDDPFDA